MKKKENFKINSFMSLNFLLPYLSWLSKSICLSLISGNRCNKMDND